jgi:hypothetical protein
MAVRSRPRNPRIQLSDHIEVPPKGRMTRLGRSTFSKVY